MTRWWIALALLTMTVCLFSTSSFAAYYYYKATQSPPLIYHYFPNNPYYFPINEIDFGFYSTAITNLYVHQYFTPPYLPVFWQGQARARQGYIVLYERNFYHTRRYFSLDWGASTAYWQSNVNKQNLNTTALFIAFKLWLLRFKRFDFYFTYSVAGPAYISQQYVDSVNLGSKFTLQDFIGLGFMAGAYYKLNASVRLFHFSNGCLVPEDPGFDVPIVFTIGMTF